MRYRTRLWAALATPLPDNERKDYMRLKYAISILCLVFTAPAQTPGPARPPVLPPDTVIPDVAGVGNFSHIVSNLDKSIEFYRDVIGLELTAPPAPFSPNPAIMKLGNTIGAQSHIALMKIPGAGIGLELIDYKDIDRKPAHPRFQDPGAGNLAILVKDIDVVAARLKKAGAHVLTAAGSPVTIQGREKGFFVQDPDGFVIEVTQLTPLPANASATPGNVFGASVEITVADTAKTAKFYRDALGFQLRVNDAFTDNKLMADTAGTPGAQFRQSSGQIPGSQTRITFIEFKNIDRKPLNTRVQDPGTAILQLRVRDVDAVVKNLKAAGATVISTGGEPVTMGNRKLAIVRDANNLFLELLPAQ
jgi:catechol 2,3-dioxygenase-like lactoylglutathione lyase family enzyme